MSRIRERVGTCLKYFRINQQPWGTTKHESEEIITQQIDFELSMAMYTAYISADCFGIE